MQEKAKKIVFDYVKANLEKTDTHVTFGQDEVYVVWFSKTLQNWKCLVSTTLPDGMYYEVTYDGDKKQTYLDAYKKWDNVCISDNGFTSADVPAPSKDLPHSRACRVISHEHGVECANDCPTCGWSSRVLDAMKEPTDG